MVQIKNMELTKIHTLTDRKLQDTIADMPSKASKKEQSLMQANQLLQLEKARTLDLIVKIQAFLRG
jgi:hypothetical protein